MATYSEIEITFLDFFISDSRFSSPLNILYEENGVLKSLDEEVVTTRSTANEFTQGSDATTQAQFYKDAIDLDYVPSGDWETFINGAVLTIKSTNQNVVIKYIPIELANIDKFEYVVNDYVLPINYTEGVLLARSNYYMTQAITDELSVEINMYFRGGNITQPLGEPNYTKKVFKPSNEWQFFDVIVSRFALDFIEPKPVFSNATTVLNSAAGSVIATTISTKTNTFYVFRDKINGVITTRGYSNYFQGANYLEKEKKILISSNENQILKDSILMIPFINDGTLTSISIKNDQDVEVYNYVPIETDIVEGKIQYLFFDTSTLDTVYFTINDTITFEVIDECKYNPQRVTFLNAFGVFEDIWFFKAKKEQTEFNQEGKYKNNFVYGGQYDTSRHLYRSGNKNARTSINLNTGYINESQNQSIEQLINSEYVYFNNAGTFIPVNVDKNSLQLLTGLNDKLINYSIDFKESFDRIQNV